MLAGCNTAKICLQLIRFRVDLLLVIPLLVGYDTLNACFRGKVMAVAAARLWLKSQKVGSIAPGQVLSGAPGSV